jgi:ribosomal-protein-alanine N-acetyltransferase
VTIEATHVRLLPYAPGDLLALIESVEQFEAQVGLRAAEGLRDFIVSDEVSPAWLERLRASTTPDPWTHGFGIVHRESGRVIGGTGFAAPPDAEGMVEIGYGIVPAYQGRGYATEAAAAITAFAFGSGIVRRVRAHTLPGNVASMRVLEKCGFERIGEVEVPEDGRVVRWERGRETCW